jgi:ABC-type lipoprotein release transport system permease subunit
MKVGALSHATPRDGRAPRAFGLTGPIAWRNLWRNRRRTLLSAGAIAFSVALLAFTMSMQAGTYAAMIDNATRLLDGHLQVQRRGYLDDPRIGNAIDGAAERVAQVRAIPGVVVATPRIAAFVLVAGDDRSYGAQLLGVDPDGERALSKLPDMRTEGRFIEGGAEAYAGRVLARNLGVPVGGKIVVLGTASNGGVAALGVTLVGTFASGIAELDRQLIEIPLATAAEAFDMPDAVHAIVVRAESVSRAHGVAEALRKDLPADEVVLEWPVLIPDLEQAIMLDRASGNVMFGILCAVVTIGVLNGFLMTVFERTREFGMLMAMGMRARGIVSMLQAEALLLSCIGCAAGVAIGVPLVLWFGHVGIPIGDSAAAMRAFHIADRLYPALNWPALVRPIVLLMVCTQLAALLPAMRVRRIQPVEALRAA